MTTLKSLVVHIAFQNSKWFGEQRFGTMSKECGKGKHTTCHVSLLPTTGGGFLADTPGFNQPSLLKVTKQILSLQKHFQSEERCSRKMSPPSTYLMTVHLGEYGCVVKGDSERYHTICRCLIRSRSENHSSYEHLEQKEVIGTKQVLWA
uniref:EngC GTPase domain-containing protein n=1 Tax=Setaria viridis TaxID=4556 RepID=A0A4U6TR98_SETVI|nr:hypothetical protein SEVIR_7G076066v2 [Setaria viridis]